MNKKSRLDIVADQLLGCDWKWEREISKTKTMSNKIPTASDWIKYYFVDDKNRDKTNADMLNDYTKLHVEAALKAATEKASTEERYPDFYTPGMKKSTVVDKSSILNAYPLTNIK